MKSISTIPPVAMLAIIGTTQRAASDKWEILGCEEVGHRPDKDVIQVGRREDRFQAIRLTAKGNDVMVQDLQVVYAIGAPDDIRVRSELKGDTDTRAPDLKGGDRAISRIELTTKRDFKGSGKRRAQVCVMGREDERRGKRG